MWGRIKKSILFNILLLAFAALFSYGAFGMMLQAYHARTEAREIDAEVESLRKKKAALEAEIAELKTPHAAEREAKERFNLKRRGENVAVILSGPAEEEKAEEKDTFWQSLKKWIFKY